VLLLFVYTCSESRSGCPDLIGKILPAPPLPGTFSGTLSERVASRLRWFPASGPRQCPSHPQTGPFLTSLRHYLLASSSLSPLAARFTGPSRMCCKQKTYVRLTSQLNPLHATLTRNTGGRVVSGLSMFQRVSTRVLYLSPFLSDSCALFGTAQNSTLLFSDDSALFAQKTPGVGGLHSRPYHAPPRHLPNPLPVPKACIGRTIGAESSFRQAIPRSQFRRFRVRLLRGRVRWVSSLVAGSSSSRASPFFVPTNN
jgi:hypothetical protein